MDGRSLVGTTPEGMRSSNIGDGEQEQVQGPSLGLAAAEHALADESMIDPTEGGGDLAQPIRPQRMFMNHKQELRERPVG